MFGKDHKYSGKHPPTPYFPPKKKKKNKKINFDELYDDCDMTCCPSVPLSGTKISSKSFQNVCFRPIHKKQLI